MNADKLPSEICEHKSLLWALYHMWVQNTTELSSDSLELKWLDQDFVALSLITRLTLDFMKFQTPIPYNLLNVCFTC